MNNRFIIVLIIIIMIVLLILVNQKRTNSTAENDISNQYVDQNVVVKQISEGESATYRIEDKDGHTIIDGFDETMVDLYKEDPSYNPW